MQIAERLANHYYLAKEIEKAFEFGVLAVEKLVTLDAVYQSLLILNKGYELSKNSMDLNKLIFYTHTFGIIYFRIGNFAKAKEYSLQLKNYSTQVKDNEHLGRANETLGEISFFTHQIEEALKYFQEAIKFLKITNAKEGISKIYASIASCYSAKGDFENSFKYYDSALEIAKENNFDDLVGTIYGRKGVTYGQQNNFQEAINCFKKEIKIARKLKILQMEGIGCGHLTEALYQSGNFSKALATVKKTLHLCKITDSLFGICSASNKAGNIHTALGNFEKALEFYLASLEICEELDLLNEIPQISEKIGKLYLEFENYEKSIEFFTLQLEKSQEIKDDFSSSKSLENIASVYFEQQYYSEAIKNLNTALKISKKIKDKKLIASQNLKKERIFVEEKEFVKAEKLIEQSKEEFPFETKLLCAKINSLTNKTDLAISELEKMSTEFKTDEEQAEILFQLTLLKNLKSLKEKSVKLYTKLYEKLPKRIYKERLSELGSLKIVESKLNLELIEKLTKWMTPETLFDEFLDYLQKETNSYASQLIIKNEQSGKFETSAVSSKLDDEETEFSETILQSAINENQPTLIENALEEEKFKTQKSILGKFFLSVIAVPLEVKDNVIGAIYLERRDFEKGSFTEYELNKVIEISRILSPILKRQNQALTQKIQSEIQKLGIFVGNSPKMQEVYNKIEDASKVNYSVYIHGETGTGKELVSQALHKLSLRRTKPFVAVNCSAIPKDLAESELFGHTKGAFSGAVATKKGKFELANEGTLYLDEVAELTLDVQAKLLRVLQNQKVWKVGSEKPIKINTRVIIATHKDLKEEVKKGTFREDLMFRLDVLKIEMPPLRERTEDISLLANHFLKKHSEEIGKEIVGFHSKAITALEQNTWTGNVRELENTILKVIVSKKNINPISYEDLLEFLQGKLKEETSPPKITTTQSEEFVGDTYAEKLDNFERKVLTQALEANNWNKSLTAKSLQLTRNKLYNLLTKHDLLK